MSSQEATTHETATRESTTQVSRLLADWRSGDEAAREQLIPLVHDELMRLAQRHMRSERQLTLQPTALVNEAYLRLVDIDVPWTGRVHFFAVAAGLMRRILVDRARRRKAVKRGGGEAPMEIDEELVATGRPSDLIALDDALDALAKVDERKCRVVELRFFAGLTIDETAEALGVSHATVERDLKMARAWLATELDEGSS